MSRVFTSVLVLAGAVAVQQAAVGAVPVNGGSMPSMASTSSAAAPSPAEMARDAYNSGIDHKNKGLKYEADAEKQQPKDRDKTLAKAKDEYGKALKDFKHAIDLVPEAYQAYNGMGFALRKTGDAAKALEMYDKALSLSPGFPDALEYRGEAYIALNRMDDAKQTYLTLFGKDRAQADQLLKVMSDWVAKRKADPAGVDAATVTGMEDWIKERAKLSSLTANMSLRSNQSIWNR
jgi:tetratricopeptide (TPR) repeat protein